ARSRTTLIAATTALSDGCSAKRWARSIKNPSRAAIGRLAAALRISLSWRAESFMRPSWARGRADHARDTWPAARQCARQSGADARRPIADRLAAARGRDHPPGG